MTAELPHWRTKLATERGRDRLVKSHRQFSLPAEREKYTRPHGLVSAVDAVDGFSTARERHGLGCC